MHVVRIEINGKYKILAENAWKDATTSVFLNLAYLTRMRSEFGGLH
jgi:hypothetical protein